MKAQTVLVLAIVAALATAGTARLATEADAAIRETAAEVTLLEHKVEALEAKIAKAKITPELEPVSDKKFFDGKRADYSTDERARRPDDFRYPFPVIQADNEYDTDYVKDENSDSGYWAAQMKYDRLRGKLYKIQQSVMKATAKAREEELEEQAAKRREEEAQQAADAAHRAHQAAKRREEEAQQA